MKKTIMILSLAQVLWANSGDSLSPQTEEVSLLEKTIITASNQQEQRREVAATVDQIKPEDLSQVQPLALAEVLNQKAGVNMVDLGNDQHAMSLRQPMSYRALYLYLEDGVPIRPIGVFNHNALIESDLSGLSSIEVFKGPASSLYGSEAIGGAVNFNTMRPQPDFGELQFQMDNQGLQRSAMTLSDRQENYGVYGSASYATRRKGPVPHSDYDKVSLKFGAHAYLDQTEVFFRNTWIDYQSDMTGSVDSTSLYQRNYRSNNTFTWRQVQAWRSQLGLIQDWNSQYQTQVTLFYRDNLIGQNPSYRLKDILDAETQEYLRSEGEINSNELKSMGAQVTQHLKWDQFEFSGGFLQDYTVNDYHAEFTDVTRDASGSYVAFQAQDSVKAEYRAFVLNQGAHLLTKYRPVNWMVLSASLRYDRIEYDFQNHLGANAYTSVEDQVNEFDQWSPKVGANFNLNSDLGIYANYSQGFTPPTISSLYIGQTVPELSPSYYENYEMGIYYDAGQGLKLELASYYTQGLDQAVTIQTVEEVDGELITQWEAANAGETDHRGVELSAGYFHQNSGLGIRSAIAYSEHQYVQFTQKVKTQSWQDTLVNYGGNTIERAPNWLANSELYYQPKAESQTRFALEHSWVDEYFLDPNNTIEFEGYSLWNLRSQFELTPSLTTSFIVKNLSDEVWSPSASYAWGRKSYTPGYGRNYSMHISKRF